MPKENQILFSNTFKVLNLQEIFLKADPDWAIALIEYAWNHKKLMCSGGAGGVLGAWFLNSESWDKVKEYILEHKEQLAKLLKWCASNIKQIGAYAGIAALAVGALTAHNYETNRITDYKVHITNNKNVIARSADLYSSNTLSPDDMHSVFFYLRYYIGIFVNSVNNASYFGVHKTPPYEHLRSMLVPSYQDWILMCRNKNVTLPFSNERMVNIVNGHYSEGSLWIPPGRINGPLLRKDPPSLPEEPTSPVQSLILGHVFVRRTRKPALMLTVTRCEGG